MNSVFEVSVIRTEERCVTIRAEADTKEQASSEALARVGDVDFRASGTSVEYPQYHVADIRQHLKSSSLVDVRFADENEAT